MESIEQYAAVDRHTVMPNEILVLGEGDDNKLCTIEVDDQDRLLGGLPANELKVRICTHPAVEALFGSLGAHNVELQTHGAKRVVLKSIARVGGGQIVHVCSRKGADNRNNNDDDEVSSAHTEAEGTVVYYGDPDEPDRYLVVPRGEPLAKWMCSSLGLFEKDHWVALRNGCMVLKSAPPPIVNNNNNNTPSLATSTSVPAVVTFFPPPSVTTAASASVKPNTSKLSEEKPAKGQAEILLPDGRIVHFTVAGVGESVPKFMAALCNWLHLEPSAAYGLYYRFAPLTAEYVLAGVKYEVRKTLAPVNP